MIQLITQFPDQETLDHLKGLQDKVDILGTFEARAEKAKKLFEQRNKKGNRTFDKVKETLTKMCSGAERCVYCEDSKCDEVEHIFPKDLYPEKCFTWDNYVYACGPCNGPKNNQFAIFRQSDGAFQIVNPSHREASIEPPPGDAVLLNPRMEDPLAYCILDLASTFKFVITANPASREYRRADYTFNTVLRLNDQREYLRQARKSAFSMYKARLFEYTVKKGNGAEPAQLEKMIDGIKKEAHPTVWKEMQRQHKMGILKKFNQEIANLFDASPEALDW